jgi:hypothetical protein
MIVYSLNGERVAEIVASGAPFDSEKSLSELIAEVRGSNARWVVIPAARLGKDFFRLAGKFVDAFVTHKLRLAILGEMDTPDSLGVSEDSVLFLRDSNELYAKLAPAQ